jgi:predicted ArsR family transcriptional regulator
MTATTQSEQSEPLPRNKLEDVPPSAKFVHWVLDREGAMTQAQLADETLLPKRTVRSALETLNNEDLVSEDVFLPDARKKVYRATAVGR